MGSPPVGLPSHPWGTRQAGRQALSKSERLGRPAPLDRASLSKSALMPAAACLLLPASAQPSKSQPRPACLPACLLARLPIVTLGSQEPVLARISHNTLLAIFLLNHATLSSVVARGLSPRPSFFRPRFLSHLCLASTHHFDRTKNPLHCPRLDFTYSSLSSKHWTPLPIQVAPSAEHLLLLRHLEHLCDGPSAGLSPLATALASQSAGIGTTRFRRSFNEENRFLLCKVILIASNARVASLAISLQLHYKTQQRASLPTQLSSSLALS